MKTRQLLYLFAVIVAGCASCNRPATLPSLEESYQRHLPDPFAARVAWKALGALFYQNEITVMHTPFARGLEQRPDTGSVLFSLSQSLYLTDADRSALLQFLSRGNSVFLAATHIDSGLLHAFALPPLQSEKLMGQWADNLQQTAVQLHPPHYTDDTRYRYYYLPFLRHFGAALPPQAVVLGTNASGMPNFIRLRYGRGICYLHAEPRVFSNYFLVQGQNLHYFQSLFAWLPEFPEHVYWNEYYTRRNRPPVAESGSGLSVLFRYPALSSAAWLVMLAAALYLYSGSKRRQRAIPERSPNRNSTVEYVEALSLLYLQRKDNRAMADKMIQQFFEHIRHRYHLQPQQAGSGFTVLLSQKAGVPAARTATLWEQIRQIRAAKSLSDAQLLELNRQLEYFYQNHA